MPDEISHVSATQVSGLIEAEDGPMNFKRMYCHTVDVLDNNTMVVVDSESTRVLSRMVQPNSPPLPSLRDALCSPLQRCSPWCELRFSDLVERVMLYLEVFDRLAIGRLPVRDKFRR